MCQSKSRATWIGAAGKGLVKITQLGNEVEGKNKKILLKFRT